MCKINEKGRTMIKMEEVDIDLIKPYKNNPREIIKLSQIQSKKC